MTLVIVELLALWVVVRIISHHGMRSVDDHRTRYRFRKSMTYAGLFFAALILVLNFSEKFEGFGVALGVAGAGIAFALQEVIASVAGWVVISVGRIYSAGDRIEVGGIKGDVIDIGMLRTTLMELGEWVKGDLYTGRIVRVSNSAALKGPVFNYSADFPFLWDEITLPVRYGSDWKHARVMFERVVHDECDTYAHASRAAWEGAVGKYQLEDAKIEPMVTMVANDNWIEFTIRYIVDYRKRRTTKHA
ncbi:MAG: mechanosensitive ion channel domain-containing protein, partial [Kofleriaceae bacterium]